MKYVCPKCRDFWYLAQAAKCPICKVWLIEAGEPEVKQLHKEAKQEPKEGSD